MWECTDYISNQVVNWRFIIMLAIVVKISGEINKISIGGPSLNSINSKSIIVSWLLTKIF